MLWAYAMHKLWDAHNVNFAKKQWKRCLQSERLDADGYRAVIVSTEGGSLRRRRCVCEFSHRHYFYCPPPTYEG